MKRLLSVSIGITLFCTFLCWIDCQAKDYSYSAERVQEAVEHVLGGCIWLARSGEGLTGTKVCGNTGQVTYMIRRIGQDKSSLEITTQKTGSFGEQIFQSVDAKLKEKK